MCKPKLLVPPCVSPENTEQQVQYFDIKSKFLIYCVMVDINKTLWMANLCPTVCGVPYPILLNISIENYLKIPHKKVNVSTL